MVADGDVMTKATKRRRDSNSDSDGEDAASVKQARVQPTQEIRSVDGGDDATDDAGLRVAVLVPFRANHAVQARQVQLDQFVPHMTAYMKQLTRIRCFHLFVMEQSMDGRKFNKGKLLNAGFDITREDYDVFIFHDVDLLPSDELASWYENDAQAGPIHLASVWDRYSENPKFFGGIVSFCRKDFIRINGFPNNFWGWGGEDDELYCRVKRKKLTIQSPVIGSITDLENLSLQEKLDLLWKSKWKCTVKKQLLQEHRATWWNNGLTTLKYDYVDAVSINPHCTKITIDLGTNDHWSDARSSLERIVAIPPACQNDEAAQVAFSRT